MFSSAKNAVQTARLRLSGTGVTARMRGQHLMFSRLDEIGPDPRFRLTPLGGGRYGLALHERNRCRPLPYEVRLHELVAVMNTDLAAWAVEWPSP